MCPFSHKQGVKKRKLLKFEKKTGMVNGYKHRQNFRNMCFTLHILEEDMQVYCFEEKNMKKNKDLNFSQFFKIKNYIF